VRESAAETQRGAIENTNLDLCARGVVPKVSRSAGVAASAATGAVRRGGGRAPPCRPPGGGGVSADDAVMKWISSLACAQQGAAGAEQRFNSEKVRAL